MFTFRQLVVAIVLLVMVGICALASLAWRSYSRSSPVSLMPKVQSPKSAEFNLPAPSASNPPPLSPISPSLSPHSAPLPPSQLQVIGW